MVDSLIIALDEAGLDFIEDPDIRLEPEPVEEEVKQAQAERCPRVTPSACISARWATFRC